jgi:hypothetical protein
MCVHLWAGEFAEAASLNDEVEGVNEVTGSHLAPYGSLALAAWQGHEHQFSKLIETRMQEVASDLRP